MPAISARELLRQARYLATKERTNPRQASLRRGVSSAYYALFHLLVTAAARELAPGGQPALRSLLARAFVHEEMANACRTFSSPGALPAVVSTLFPDVAVPAEVRRVAQAFIDLQKARHDADYGTNRVWTRVEAITEVERAEQAFGDWETVRPRSRKDSQRATALSATRLFLVWLAFQKKLQGR